MLPFDFAYGKPSIGYMQVCKPSFGLRTFRTFLPISYVGYTSNPIIKWGVLISVITPPYWTESWVPVIVLDSTTTINWKTSTRRHLPRHQICFDRLIVCNCVALETAWKSDRCRRIGSSMLRSTPIITGNIWSTYSSSIIGLSYKSFNVLYNEWYDSANNEELAEGQVVLHKQSPRDNDKGSRSDYIIREWAW